MTTERDERERPDSSDHLTVRPAGLGPAEVHFLFEQPQKHFGGALGASVMTHLAILGLLLLLARLLPQKVYESVLPDRFSDQIVWLSEPGPGGGGGGGGNKTPEPPKKAELPGKQKISVPAVKPPAPTPEPPKPEPPKPEQQVNIPAQTMASAQAVTPGTVDQAPPAATASQGAGSGGGAGTGTGTGIGQGQGSGLGAGIGGGTGGGVYHPGNGVQIPRPIKEVKPQYTAEAMRAKVQGTVVLDCVVLPDGTVGDVHVVKSLDPTFGLDQEAIKAAKQWRFYPGTRMGEPVAVLVTLELSFNLR